MGWTSQTKFVPFFWKIAKPHDFRRPFSYKQQALRAKQTARLFWQQKGSMISAKMPWNWCSFSTRSTNSTYPRDEQANLAIAMHDTSVWNLRRQVGWAESPEIWWKALRYWTQQEICICIHIYIYTHIYMCTYTYTYTYIYIHIPQKSQKKLQNPKNCGRSCKQKLQLAAFEAERSQLPQLDAEGSRPVGPTLKNPFI